ncbi:MAG: cysteine desulfurase family protein [Hyphomicrobiales bacterium]
MRAYLDHNATSPLRPEARAAMLRALDEAGNASSVHAEGRRARAVVEDARDTLAGLLGVRPDMIVFTSGGTEANALAFRALGVTRYLVSAVEHPSVHEAALAAGSATLVPVDSSGVVDLEALERLLAQGHGPALVSIMLANNETGVIQPVREAAEIVHRHGGVLHVDATQGLGRIPVRFAMTGADLMALSAHKFGGPVGAGALVVSDAVALLPLQRGGRQEQGRRAGTENVPAIAGMAAAASVAMGEDTSRINGLRDKLESVLQGAVVFGKDATRLPNTVAFARPGLLAETALIALDLDGVAVSSGSACSSGKVASSAVLAAMGVDPALAQCALRVSLGWTTTVSDIEAFAAAWQRLLARHAALRAA